MAHFGCARDGTADSTIAQCAERRVLGIGGRVRRHEYILDKARIAVLDILDATEQFGDVEGLPVHRGHDWHQQIKPFQKAPLRADSAAENHAEMRM